MSSPLRSLLLLFCCLSSAACFGQVSQQRASHQFRASFDCPTAQVHASAGGGYRVQGCGATAFYRCEESPLPVDPRTAQMRTGSDDLFEALLQSADHAIRAPGICRLSSAPASRAEVDRTSERGGPPDRQVAHALGEPAPWARHETIALEGGSLQLSADELERPDYIVMTLRSARPVFYEPCHPWFTTDGALLVAHAVAVRSTPDQVELVIARRQLQKLARSSRFAAHVCGMRFSLDGAARRMVARFAEPTPR